MARSPPLSDLRPNTSKLPHKDIDTQTVAGLRRILSSAGYGTGAGHVAVKGQND